jgi:SAM-dependent methyltransferase
VAEPDFLRATRAAYDAVAADYAVRFRDELADRPLDRAMLAGFAELVRTAGAGPVADIGCGTGRVTALLSSLGVPAFGVDLSPQMVAVARRSQPDLRFEVGSMLSLDLPDGCLGGVMAWYSTIHIPTIGSRQHSPSSAGSWPLVAWRSWRSNPAMTRCT